MANRIKTNIEALDRVIGGLKKGELVLIGGRPAMGKTMLALHMMHVMANQQKAKSILFSYAPDLDMKYMQHLHFINEEESELFSISKLTNIDSIKSECKEAIVDIIFVDYFQLIEAENDIPETERYYKILVELKALAQDMDCPVVLLSQISRDVEGRENHRPILSDLTDLGQHGKVSDYADTVCFLYRDNYYNEAVKGIGIAELIIAKHDETGVITTIELPFFMDYFKTPLTFDTSIESVNERFRRLRADVHMTQQELADRINVSSKTVSKWESGRGLPEVSLLVPLSRVLGVTVDYLLDCKI